MKKKHIIKIFFMISGLGLSILILLKADFVQAFEQTVNIRPMYLFLLVLMQVMTIALIHVQWLLIGRKIKPDISSFSIFDMNMNGTFVESITPATKMGGEAVKVLFLKKNEQISTGQATAIVSFQKMISMGSFLVLFVSFFIVAIIELTLSFQQAKGFLWGFLILTGFLLICVLAYLWVKKKVLCKNKYKKINEFIQSFHHTFVRLKKDKSKGMQYVALAMIIWLLFVFKTQLVMQGFGFELSFFKAGVLTFLPYMAGMLPLTPGGIGTYEGTMVLIGGWIQMSAASVMVTALVLRFVTFWLVWIFSGFYLGIRKILLYKERRKVYGNKKAYT